MKSLEEVKDIFDKEIKIIRDEFINTGNIDCLLGLSDCINIFNKTIDSINSSDELIEKFYLLEETMNDNRKSNNHALGFQIGVIKMKEAIQ